MSCYRFFQELLTRVEEIQTALNTLREKIKEEIQNDAQTFNPAE